MALGHKTLDDLVGPITKQLGHGAVAEKVEMPKWEFCAQRVTDGLSHSELVDMFVSEAEKIRVNVTRCLAGELVEAVCGIVGQGVPETGEACAVVCAQDDRLIAAGLAGALAEQDLVSGVTVWDPEAGDANVEVALAATYGITYAAGGIAETATVVQPTNPQCGRAISLLPLVHIAIVDASAIVPTMLEVMKGYESADASLPSQVCFISGPSATADIELVRVEGVHGPMYVHYIVVE